VKPSTTHLLSRDDEEEASSNNSIIKTSSITVLTENGNTIVVLLLLFRRRRCETLTTLLSSSSSLWPSWGFLLGPSIMILLFELLLPFVKFVSTVEVPQVLVLGVLVVRVDW
jgi:hypothetical protein